MIMSRPPIRQLIAHLVLFLWGLSTGLLMPWHSAEAGVPVSLYQSYAGNMNFTATGGTLRTQSNTVNACTVTNSNSATLSGIPVGATITAAYLYWAGSGSTPDYNVTFDGVAVSADRTFTETFTLGRTFFSGFKDVTAQVTAKRNGTYSFANLTVDNTDATAPYCSRQTVLSGWSLLVIYENASEPLRVINVFDGLLYYQNSSLALTPSNFLVPNSSIDGRHGVLTWEGDATLGGASETLTVNGTALTDALNPANNQFNSTINILGSNTTYGVDLDIYDISALLSPGDTSVTSIYSAGQDMVLLNMEVLSVTNIPVADLAISKTHSGNFTVGLNGSYTLSVSNNGPSTEPGTITVTDTLPTGLGYVSATGTGWSCGAVGQDVTCTHAGPLNSGASLPDITMTVSVAAAAAPSVTNTASVSGTAFDNQAGNNSSSDATVVLQPDLSTSTKTVVDLNGGDADPGDILRYTITLIENGGAAATNISVTDNLPANTTGLSIVSYPAGATDNSTAVLIDISNISIAAGGSDTIVFDVTVSGSANPGDTIDNTATINNPGGPGATPAAPTIVVSESSIAASGNKHLYLYTSLNLSRVTPTAAQAQVATNSGNPDPVTTWTLNPNLQSNLQIDNSSGFINVNIWLRESGNGSDRSFTLTLAGSTSGIIGTLPINNLGLATTPTLYTYSIPITGATNLVAGEAITMTLTNRTNGNGRFIHVLPSDGGVNHSYVHLPSNTVINIDSVQYYDAAYPGGSLITATAPGPTVYVRAVVSDPFGSFDITSSYLTLLDPVSTPVVNNLAMTQVADSGAATRTYEYAYTIPTNGLSGSWTAQVTANEGSEGTISHQRNASLLVSAATLSVIKSVQTISDPLNGTTSPYNIPGARLLYSIQVTNGGIGSTDTDTVIINDTIPANTALQVTDLGGAGTGPVLFIDGSPVSGLTYTYTALGNMADDLEFSIDGVVWTYTPIPDANGVDNNVRYIRANPKSAMLGNGGGGDPNFELRFMVVVQ